MRMLEEYTKEMLHQGGVYQIEDKLSGTIYVGAAKDFLRRWKVHLRDLAKGKGVTAKFQHYYDKHKNPDALEFSILQFCNRELDRYVYEKMWWRELSRDHEMLNSEPSGTNLPSSFDINDYFRRKKSREKIQKIKGSDIYKKKISESMKKLWEDPEYRKMQSESHKGYNPTEEQKRKISEANSHPKSEETRKKMSESAKNRPASFYKESVKRLQEGAKKYREEHDPWNKREDVTPEKVLNFYINNYSVSDIAKVLHCGEGTIRQRLRIYGGCKKIKEEYE